MRDTDDGRYKILRTLIALIEQSLAVASLAGDAVGPALANVVQRIRGNPVAAGAATGVGTLYTWNGAAFSLEAGMGGPWIATVTHAASPFSPSAGARMIPVDTTAGAVTINTPGFPFDGQFFFVKDVTGNAAVTPITVAASGGSTIEDPSNPGHFGATGTLAGQGQSVGFKYKMATTQWIAFVIDDPAAAVTLAGDAVGPAGSNVVQRINGATVPAAVTPGNVLQVSAANVDTYGPVNLAGGPNFVTGALPAANQAPQTMGGDVTGTTAASVVAKIQGNAISAAQAQNLLALFLGTWGATVVHAGSPFLLTAAAPLKAFDTTAGAIVFNTPAAPFDGMVIGLKSAVASATPATLHANNGGGEVVEDPGNSGTFGANGTLAGQGPAFFWKYRASDTRWIGFIGV
jgi:hypothetical protein